MPGSQKFPQIFHRKVLSNFRYFYSEISSDFKKLIFISRGQTLWTWAHWNVARLSTIARLWSDCLMMKAKQIFDCGGKENERRLNLCSKLIITPVADLITEPEMIIVYTHSLNHPSGSPCRKLLQPHVKFLLSNV